MKKYFLLFSILFIGLSACNKGDIVAQQAAVDDAKIQAFIQANGYTMTKDPSGLYYEVIKPGTGNYPIATSTVKIGYTASYLNGQVFTSVASASYTLSDPSLIQGFPIGLQLINTGGRIRIIFPSGLAYGPAGNGSIPANAVLVYVIDMIGFY